LNYLFVMPKNSAKSSGGFNVFPVGITYVSAYMKKHGFNVFTVNLEFDKRNTEQALKDIIVSNNIGCVCVSGLSRDYSRVKDIVDISNGIDSSIITVVGGGIITGDPEPAMIALGADIGVVGQGEETMVELATAINADSNLHDILGLIYKRRKFDRICVESDEFSFTGFRKDVSDLDFLPFPDYEGFDYDKYLKQIDNENTFIVASRSCPFKCTFCFHPSGDRYRKRSIDNIFVEIEYLHSKYGINNLVVSDELFSPKRSRIIDFCNKIKNYDFTWACQLRVSDVDESLLGIMKDSGCVNISFGVESVDDDVLESMDKKITSDQIKQALLLTHKSGIEIQGGLIFGDVRETLSTAHNSLSWNDKHLHYGLELNMIQVFPGTILYENACKDGVILDRVEFLMEKCPQINVSQMSDSEYKRLASDIYRINMLPKYGPKEYEVSAIDTDAKAADVNFKCLNCGFEQSLNVDLLHVTRSRCSSCNQRHYMDIFNSVGDFHNNLENTLSKDTKVAIWGAGELCIKLLERYDFIRSDKFVVVDASAARHGYSISGKNINSTSVIDEYEIKTVIISVIRYKDDVLEQLEKYDSVVNRYFVDVGFDRSAAYLELQLIP
jgi:anaerobic magnesium-protoporphyrin IX monomethyl ester cyclase